MSFVQKLHTLINNYIHLSGKISSKGFRQIRCPCCSDHSPRGGWRIELDEIQYHCFNCGIDARWHQGDEHLSKKFQMVLRDFGIPDRELTELKGFLFFNKGLSEEKVITLDSITKVDLFTPEVKLPKGSKRLEEDNEFTRFLYDKYRLTLDDYPFFFNDVIPMFKNRVIIPFFRQGKIIYWQARTIIPNENPRYRNCEAKKEAVIFNYDELFKYYSTKPLFICEGIFDAIHVNGISLLGSKLTPAVIELLKRSHRQLVFVIDKDANGHALANQVLREKLGTITFVTTPSVTKSKIDISSRIVETGKIWVMNELFQNQIDDEKKAGLYINFLPKHHTGRNSINVRRSNRI